MINEIKKLEGVKHLLSTVAYENAVSGLFTINQKEINNTKELLNESFRVADETQNADMVRHMLQIQEIQKDTLKCLKKKRRDAKQYIASEKNEWAEEGPINLGDILTQYFKQNKNRN